MSVQPSDDGLGRLRNVSISNVQADGANHIACSITGLPERAAQSIALDNIRQMMESTLASYAFQPAAQAGAKPQEEDAAEERLSRLDLALSLDPPNPQPKIWGEG